MHVKKGDTVVVLNGKSKGVKGKVLFAYPDKKRVLVEGVGKVSKCYSPKNSGPTKAKTGIVQEERPINASNVMLVCNKCSKPAKVGRKILNDGSKARVCKKCGEMIDIIKKPKDE